MWHNERLVKYYEHILKLDMKSGLVGKPREMYEHYTLLNYEL